jgi:hypothetical protein
MNTRRHPPKPLPFTFEIKSSRSRTINHISPTLIPFLLTYQYHNTLTTSTHLDHYGDSPVPVTREEEAFFYQVRAEVTLFFDHTTSPAQNPEISNWMNHKFRWHNRVQLHRHFSAQVTLSSHV